MWGETLVSELTRLLNSSKIKSMPKLLPVILSLLVFLIVSNSAFAQGFKLPSTDIGTDKFNASSLFYIFKTLKEDITLLFNQNKSSKLKQETDLAITRLKEVNALAGSKSEERIVETLDRYKKHVDSMVALMDSDQSKTLEQLGTNLGVLQRVYDKVENQKAKEAIARAIDRENNQIQDVLSKMTPAIRRGVERLVLYRQVEAVRFLRRESTGSALPKEYATTLKTRYEKREQSIQQFKLLR